MKNNPIYLDNNVGVNFEQQVFIKRGVKIRVSEADFNEFCKALASAELKKLAIDAPYEMYTYLFLKNYDGFLSN